MDSFLNVEEEVSDESSTDSGNQENVFAHLETNYNQIMMEMCEDPTLSHYADEYTAMFDYAYSVHLKSLNLASTREQLEVDYAETERRLQETSQVLLEDATLISSLRGDVHNSHKLLDTAHEREQAAMEVIDNLRHTINSLQQEIDFKNKMTEADDEENPTVAKHRQGLERERVKLIKEVTKMNEKFEAALQYQEELEQRTDQTDAQIHEIIGKLEDATVELTKHKRVKVKLEQEVYELSDELHGQNKEIDEMTYKATADQRAVVKLDSHLKEQIFTSTKCFKEVNSWNQRYCKMQDELNQLSYQAGNERRETEKSNKRLALHMKEHGLLTQDIEMHQMQKQISQQKREQLLAEAHIVTKERNHMREEVNQIDEMILSQKYLNDAAKREIVDHIRECDMIRRNLTRQQDITKANMNTIAMQQGIQLKMELKVESQVENEKEQRKHMAFLERERDRLKEDAADKVMEIEDLMDEVKAQKLKMFDGKKRLADSQNRLRMQLNLFDACRADKQMLEKTVREHLIHNEELKMKLYNYNRNNEMMKHEVFYKEQAVLRKSKEFKSIDIEKDGMQKELEQNLREMHELKESIGEHKFITKDLLRQIEHADFKMREGDKKIATYMKERDVLGAQLVRGNDELALLYKKSFLLKTMLECGESQYSSRLDDITLLKREIIRIRQNKSLYEKKISNMNDFKSEVLELEKDLTRERIKCKMLQEEMRNPLNIHRWSKLEGSDPEMFKLMRRILMMQKRLLYQARHIHSTQVQLREIQTLYKNTRQMLSKQPGPNIHNRLKRTKNGLLESIGHTKHLMAERKVTEDESNHCSLEFRHVSLALRKERQKLLHEKKLRRLDMEKWRRVEQRGQHTIDKMAKLMSDKTILALAAKPSIVSRK